MRVAGNWVAAPTTKALKELSHIPSE